MPDTITPPEGGLYVGNQEDVENAVIFSIGDPEPVEVLKLTKDGLYYQGEFVDDAGQALTGSIGQKSRQSLARYLLSIRSLVLSQQLSQTFQNKRSGSLRIATCKKSLTRSEQPA